MQKKLKIPHSGIVTLEMEEDDFVGEAEYYTSTNGRIRFRNGWMDGICLEE
jgi:hypothetical protein